MLPWLLTVFGASRGRTAVSNQESRNTATDSFPPAGCSPPSRSRRASLSFPSTSFWVLPYRDLVLPVSRLSRPSHRPSARWRTSPSPCPRCFAITASRRCSRSVLAGARVSRPSPHHLAPTDIRLGRINARSTSVALGYRPRSWRRLAPERIAANPTPSPTPVLGRGRYPPPWPTPPPSPAACFRRRRRFRALSRFDRSTASRRHSLWLP